MKKKSLWMLGMMCFFAALCSGQVQLLPLSKTVSEYPFVNYNKNVLDFPSGKESFIPFYGKVNNLVQRGTGNINILHIGGSHVQADVFSHRMRSNLSSMTANAKAGRGCLFPFEVLNTNASKNYTITYTGSWKPARCVGKDSELELGIMGAAIQTCDTAASLSLRLNTNDSLNWNFCRLKVMGYASDSLTYPVLVLNGDTLLPYQDNESGYFVFSLPDETEHIRMCFRGMENGTFTLTGMLPENDQPGITYHSAGVNGAAVPSWLRCVNMKRDLHLINPDMVIFGIGINDANVSPRSFNPEAFKQNYRELINRILQVNPHCALLFITNNDCYLNVYRHKKTYNPNTTQVEIAFSQLAAEYKGAVWNLFEIMGGYRSSTAWKNNGMMRSDRIHFTHDGYVLLGDLLYNALITDYLRTNGI